LETVLETAAGHGLQNGLASLNGRGRVREQVEALLRLVDEYLSEMDRDRVREVVEGRSVAKFDDPRGGEFASRLVERLKEAQRDCPERVHELKALIDEHLRVSF
jgi:hypothetical protein